jgi:hypothetical protein
MELELEMYLKLDGNLDLKLVHGYWIWIFLVYGKWSRMELNNEIDLIYIGIGFHYLYIK